MFNPQPIQTEYAGCLFRSRLEARWAVFLDAMHIRWEYEKEGYTLAGERYLPDFWIPNPHVHIEGGEGVQPGCWLEIKPVGLTPVESMRLDLLVRDTGHRAYAVCGEPWPGKHHVVIYQHHHLGRPERIPLHEKMEIIEHVDHLSDVIVGLDLVGDSGKFVFVGPDPGECRPGSLLRAFQAARRARFEHGESPKLPDQSPHWQRRSA